MSPYREAVQRKRARIHTIRMVRRLRAATRGMERFADGTVFASLALKHLTYQLKRLGVEASK